MRVAIFLHPPVHVPAQAKGLITPAQRHALTTELAARLHPIL
jgi:hypothetical protein